MAIGDVFGVESLDDVHYVDTGMYDVAEYGAVYVVDAERPAVVDTGVGTNYERILDAIEEVGLAVEDIEAILVTHVHLDHAGGAGFLAAETGADVYVHEIGGRHLVDPSALVQGTKRAVGDQWQFYVEPKPVPEDQVVEVSGGDSVDLGDRTMDVVHVPGHAPHQVAYHDRRANAVYVADAAGIWIPAEERVRETSPPSDFDLEQCLDDVETLRGLDADVLCYPHFGPVDDTSVLDDYEDVLTDWVERVAAKRAELEDDEAVVEYFAEHNDVEGVWDDLKAREETAMNVRGVLLSLDRQEER
ncbi:MBL fold metallo-hydrolase [Halocalculus aciditolerans]|uniref:MBL fold hydrolase n=1 Tax=Halocalculus aciditolerans TaxID=1383812 RepID=A0A830F2M9_9EURY|nr:MBL fold metallo-hydrolase [Halocalculus aciditolerans]GGL49359.1 MBL fold hydrolase [Halocalculus aciditolerans]